MGASGIRFDIVGDLTVTLGCARVHSMHELDKLGLRPVPRWEALTHALEEARLCIRTGALCSCLGMLRKAVDLWTAEYRDRFGITFDKVKGEKDTLHWRLRKIAEANVTYAATVHAVIDGLRLDANDALHDETACLFVASPGATQPFRRLLEHVIDVVAITHPEIRNHNLTRVT